MPEALVDLGPLTRVALPGGIELDCLDVGSRDAPVLVFLHGFPESHRTWRHQLLHLKGRYRCIAPDQRGYRGSSKPAEVTAYRPELLVGDVFALASALGVERFTVIGHDWGGAIAWLVAMMGQLNDRVERLVIANAPHPAIFQRLLYTDPVQRAASQYMRAFRDPANDALVREHGLAALLAKALGGSTGAGFAGLEPAERDDLLAGWADPETALTMLNWYRASPVDVPPPEAPFALPEGWTPPPLPRLAMPVLVAWGMDDTALPPGNITGLAAQIENLTLVEIPGTGHFVTWQAPAALNAAIDAFLAKTEAPPR